MISLIDEFFKSISRYRFDLFKAEDQDWLMRRPAAVGKYRVAFKVLRLFLLSCFNF